MLSSNSVAPVLVRCDNIMCCPVITGLHCISTPIDPSAFSAGRLHFNIPCERTMKTMVLRISLNCMLVQKCQFPSFLAFSITKDDFYYSKLSRFHLLVVQTSIPGLAISKTWTYKACCQENPCSSMNRLRCGHGWREEVKTNKVVSAFKNLQKKSANLLGKLWLFVEVCPAASLRRRPSQSCVQMSLWWSCVQMSLRWVCFSCAVSPWPWEGRSPPRRPPSRASSMPTVPAAITKELNQRHVRTLNR